MVRSANCLLYLVLVLPVCALVEYAVQKGCPEGREVGDTWTDHDDGTCSKCTCMDGETFIQSCDDALAEVVMEVRCYVKSKPGNTKAKYPNCCPEDKMMCPGDPGYSEEEMIRSIKGAV